MTAIGINGFGRIGRNILRASRGQSGFEVKLINDLCGVETMAHLFKYDSNYGVYPGEVRVEEGALVVDGQRIQITAVPDPAQLPWSNVGESGAGVDVVLECSGRFNTREGGEKHLSAGAKKVLFSAPSKGEDITVVKGVNLNQYQKDQHHLISNASCTTNCLAPVVKVLHEKFEVQYGLMNTVHAYTNDQSTLDQPHSDLRRARAAALSMIPTSTGAASAIGLVLPELKGKLDGFSIRVPTPTVSAVDVTMTIRQSTDVAGVNDVLRKAADSVEWKGVLDVCEEPLVSVDYKGNPHSSIVDALSTRVIGGQLVKVLAWYDNEWGFSNRMVEVSQVLL